MAAAAAAAMARGGGAVTKKVLSLRELQMAKRMLNQPKVPPCQRELTALLNAMDRKEKGEEVSIRILQTALEHCLQQADVLRTMGNPSVGMSVLARATKRK